MFLDLKGSTSIADRMEADKYFGFLHQYFTEMSEPILETDAEIYQYVGDEVVLTWRMKAGLEEGACIRAFFLIEDQIRANRELFLSRYGVVPEFKAGVHAGTVITAQIGELKSEIERGLWSVLGADAGTALKKDTDRLWEDLLRQSQRLRASWPAGPVALLPGR